MHALIEQLPQPTPDFEQFAAVLRRERPQRIPLVELAVAPRVTDTLLGLEPSEELDEIIRRDVQLLHRLGYDAIKVPVLMPFTMGSLNSAAQPDIGWLDEHRGPIQSRDDFERYVWPTTADMDFRALDVARDALPEGMGVLAFCGGVLEFATYVMGMEHLLLATRRDPELVRDVVERLGRAIYEAFAACCQRPEVRVLWLGDDLGHKHGTLLSPKWLREHTVPWYRRFAELAHANGRSFMLHSCGDTRALMPDFVAAGIDAKHSFEDVIQPVEQWYDDWHEQTAILGGIDLHLLAAATPAEVRRRTLEVLGYVADRGGYACGSGNSIPGYVPVENYIAMIAATVEFNGG